MLRRILCDNVRDCEIIFIYFLGRRGEAGARQARGARRGRREAWQARREGRREAVDNSNRRTLRVGEVTDG